MRKIEVILADDLDGTTTNVETIEFSLGTEKWSLDLNKKHRAELRRALSRYVEAAQRSAEAPPEAVGDPEARKEQNARIRQWAIEHNLAVPQRGRLPKAIFDKYEEYERNRTHVG